MMLKKLNLLIATLAISGCAATGHTYSDHLKAQTPLASGTSRITIYRTGDSSQNSARDARISLDEKAIGKVAYKGFATFEIAPGGHMLTADMWDAPGACKLKLDISPETDYYFEVTPRVESMIGAMAFGFIGAAVESAGKECGGAFAITAKPKEHATLALNQLRLTQ